MLLPNSLLDIVTWTTDQKQHSLGALAMREIVVASFCSVL